VSEQFGLAPISNPQADIDAALATA